MIDYTVPLDELPDPLPIEPLSEPFDVTITPPGSKSITCRAYVLAALADGESRIVRPLRADDTDRLLDALCTLGAEARWDGEDVLIKGVNGRFPRGGEVNLGDGGAPTRFMIAAACLAAEPVTVDGSLRMRERPIADGVELLRQLGAKIEYVESEGRLPVMVTPSDVFRGGTVEIPTTLSSQPISALLLIAPFLPNGICLRYTDGITSKSYVTLTEHVLSRWSASVEGCVFAESDGVTSRSSRPPGLRVPHHHLRSRAFPIEPDASSAAYWIVAVGICPRSKVCLPGMRWPSLQPDIGVVKSLDDSGVDIEALENGFGAVGPDRLRWGIEVDAADMPDGSVALAAAAAMGDRPSVLKGLRTLRVKETDRIDALANELGRVGCTVQTTADSITIDPSTRHDDPVVIETYNDHRMAMAFGVLGLARPGISIRNPACVSKSYPTFWKDFARLYGN